MAKSFGFSNPPSVSLSILMEERGGESEREREREMGKGREVERGNTTVDIFVFC